MRHFLYTLRHTLWLSLALLTMGLPAWGNDAVQVEGNTPASLTLSFPTPMIPAEKVETEAVQIPIAISPAVKGVFTWKSETEGEFEAKSPVAPGTTYTITAAKGIKDLAGKPIPAFQQQMTTDPFQVESWIEPGTISRRPAVPLRFSAPVTAESVLASTYFQDRDTRQRTPVEIVIDEFSDRFSSELTVTPRVDLPPGSTVDLIIDGLEDAASKTKLPQIDVIPVGTTDALKIEKIAAFHYPLARPRIAFEFNDDVAPDEAKKIGVAPAVKGAQWIAKEKTLWLEGDFDVTQRYTVTVPREVTGKRGFGLAKESRWGATFHPKKPALIFPGENLLQRGSLGLNFAFIQVNTGPLEWRLARVPPEKVYAIHQRVREFTEKRVSPIDGEKLTDPATGLPLWVGTELLIDASQLDVVATGKVEASPRDADTKREIRWKPPTALLAGTYLIEVTGKNGEGKLLGNRALISFTEYAAIQKITPQEVTIRLMHLGRGTSEAEVEIVAMTDKNVRLAKARTDADGIARFSRAELHPKAGVPAAWFAIQTAESPILHPADGSSFFNTGNAWSHQSTTPPAFRAIVAPDRPLYRPKESMKFKGYLRALDRTGALTLSGKPRKIRWAIERYGGYGSYGDPTGVEGSAIVDDYGGFEGEWEIPANLKVDRYQLVIRLDKEHTPIASSAINIQEFRPPPFYVSFTPLAVSTSTAAVPKAGVRISSTYFHGAANAGARVVWKAAWKRSSLIPSDGLVLIGDSPQASGLPYTLKTTGGKGTLDNDGSLVIETSAPFTDGVPRGWYQIRWEAEITGVDGQTVVESAEHPLFAIPYQLKVSARHPTSAKDKAIPFTADAIAPDQQPVQEIPVTVDLYRVSTKSVREQISPFIYRYRNTTLYEKEQSFAGRTPFSGTATAAQSGEYLVISRLATSDSTVPLASWTVYISGEAGEYPQHHAQEIGVTSDRPEVTAGETVGITLQTPFTGVAWICVEAEGVLDSFFVQVQGNTSRFDLPVKKTYAPNVVVSAYLLHPGGDASLPAERYGYTMLKVLRPDLALNVTPHFTSQQVQPRSTISGEIAITSNGQPVANADLTLYAVDESILDAGDWHEPPLRDELYPTRPWRVATYPGLLQLALGVSDASLHQKGFIIGGSDFKGGPFANIKELRTQFPPRALWQTGLRSDREGKVPFSFAAPDALTRYRLIALAQTKQHQFGTGSDWVEISKPLQIEPALPRFLRVGDEVELRAVLRQKAADSLPITLRCEAAGGLSFLTPQTQTVTAAKDLPQVVRFRAKVGETEQITLRFFTQNNDPAAPSDAVELTLPVHPPTLLQKEAISGKPDELAIPARWGDAKGHLDYLLSTSPWLPKLNAIPQLLEYPHGCMEQISSRVLTYTELASLLDTLPASQEKSAAYRLRIEAGLKSMTESLTPEGHLPYWPGGTASPLPTIAGYWAARSAQTQKFNVPPRLIDSLSRATKAIALGKTDGQPFARAFALMVLSTEETSKPYAATIKELYLRREKWDIESRALLAIAMNHFGIMPQEQEQLAREIDTPVPEEPFDPKTFSSPTRVDAIKALAFATLPAIESRSASTEALKEKIEAALDTAPALSTQESYWTLLAFKAMQPASKVKAAPSPAYAAAKPSAISRNGASAVWADIDLLRLPAFLAATPHPESKLPLTALITAEYRSNDPKTARADRGMRLERTVKNLTDQARTGTPDAPYRLGDQLLITYRLQTSQRHYYIALTDELPAALELVNTNIDSIARTSTLPPGKDEHPLALSYSELRDRTANLFFDHVVPGLGTHSVLARVTSAGDFIWPSTQVAPMYDARFSGLTPSTRCSAVGE